MKEVVPAGGSALFGGGVCVGGLVGDWGGGGRGGSVEVGEGGILNIWLSSEDRCWDLWGKL